MRIGSAIVPTGANAQMWLRFSQSDPRRFIPAWSLLEGQVAREEIEGRIILVGTSAPGLFDLRATPLNAAVPGVEIHAQAIEQILLADHLHRPDFATGAELSFLIMFGLLLSALVYRSGALWSALIGAMMIASAVVVSWAAYVSYAWLFDPIYPTLALTVLFIATTVYRYLTTEVERNRVRTAFAHYLAPVLVEELASHPEKLRLGGETRTVTLYRSDLANFSALAEVLRPHELVALMNEYLSAMTTIIMQYGGFVDKYIGDAIDGVFGAPLDDPEQALNAVKAALSCQKKLADMNAANLPALRGQMLQQRIGLRTGAAIVGNIGSQQRFNYTVMGDAANLASRLEGANKVYGTKILVSEATADRAGASICWRELDVIQVVGKDEHVRIYEPLALAADRTQQQATLAAAYAEGLARWRTMDFAGAVESFNRFSDCDPPARLFRERARRLMSASLPNPWLAVNVLGKVRASWHRSRTLSHEKKGTGRKPIELAQLFFGSLCRPCGAEPSGVQNAASRGGPARVVNVSLMPTHSEGAGNTPRKPHRPFLPATKISVANWPSRFNGHAVLVGGKAGSQSIVANLLHLNIDLAQSVTLSVGVRFLWCGSCVRAYDFCECALPACLGVLCSAHHCCTVGGAGDGA